MATATITLKDGNLPGEVLINLDFGENVDLGKSGTPAQHAAIELVSRFQTSPPAQEKP